MLNIVKFDPTPTADVSSNFKIYATFKTPTLFSGVRYQYFAAPATPIHSSYPTTPMGAIGFITTGTTIYNPLSGPDGSLASYYEWNTLDPCYGHSSPDKQYHYHAVRSR